MIIKYFDEFEGTWIDISGATGSTLEYGASGWTSTAEIFYVYGTITQTGSSAPSLTIIRDNAGYGANLVPTYVNTGEYNIYSPDSIFSGANAWVLFANHAGINTDQVVIQTYTVDSDNLKVYTYKSGSLSDDILLDTAFEIRYHN